MVAVWCGGGDGVVVMVMVAVWCGGGDGGGGDGGGGGGGGDGGGGVVVMHNHIYSNIQCTQYTQCGDRTIRCAISLSAHPALATT